MSKRSEFAEYLTERVERLSSRVSIVTVPVYCSRPHSQEHVGSAVLLAVGDERFAITAAHVTDLRADGLLYIGGRTTPVQLIGHLADTTAPNGSREFDRVDIAVVCLAQETREHLVEDEFLTLDEIDARVEPRHDDYFLVAGYPCSKQRLPRGADTIDAYLYPFVAVSKDEGAYESAGYDSRNTLLLGFHQKEMWRRDLGQVTAPKLYGMSGGGIWHLPGYDKKQASPPKLSGIAIEWHSDARRQVLGTRMVVPLAAIWRDFPMVRPLIESLGQR